MAEKILVSASTGVLNSLLGKLATLMAEEYAKLKGVRKEVAFLHEEFSSMGALLEDLADKEELDNQTKQWRNRVREMSYDTENCLDEFMHRVGGSNDGKGLLHRLKMLRARHQLANQIEELKAHVQEVSARRTRYKLDDYAARSSDATIGPHMRYKVDDYGSGSSNVVVDPRITSLYVESSKLIGIDGPKEDVINLLTNQEDASVQELRVVSIVGFGGLGKTTLANEVYNKLGEKFDCKAFVSVSQRPHMMMLLKNLVTQILGPRFDTSELNGLIDNLRKYLKDKRYLVVVDDLWDASAWEIIKCAFPEGNYCSRVLTTTRIESVAVTCCNFQWEFVYRMKPLDVHNSRQLFYRRAFGLGNACPQPLEEPSEKILQKCGGLPLAIISISSLLASQLDKSLGQWNYVLNSLGSDIGSNPSLEGMRHILNLSYTHLPRHLKTCLLYIGMYPEDFDIRKHLLAMQWVAEGFVSGLNERDPVEIAGSYFNELVNRSMIIQLDYCSWNGLHNTHYKVHDMVLDLIVSKSTEENFLAVVQNLQTISTRQQYNARRISLQPNVSGLDKSAPRISLPNARSLFIFGISLHSFQLLELKFVRVLFLFEVDGLDLTPIGNLFQLRNLVVDVKRESKITQLQQICGLRHLETLCIRRGLFRLPRGIFHLPALSYLRLDSGIAYPNGINNMKSLRTLRFFDPSMQSVDNVRALGKLLNLSQLDLWIHDQSFSTKEAHMGALLYSIEKLINCNLRCLSVVSDDDHTGHYDGWNSLCLSSCHLQELDMHFRFPRLPAWVGQLSTLVSLKIQLDELRKDDIAVLAGLPVLADLVLRASHAPEESIVFSSSAVFRNLSYFSVLAVKAGLSFHFQGGAMPKVETMGLLLRVDEVKTFGVRLHGIQNLPSLKRVFIRLECGFRRFIRSDEESEVPTIEAAIRSFFIEHLPGGATIGITRCF